MTRYYEVQPNSKNGYLGHLLNKFHSQIPQVLLRGVGWGITDKWSHSQQND